MVLSKGCYIKSGHSVGDRAPVIPMKVAQFWKWNESFHGWGYDAQKKNVSTVLQTLPSRWKLIGKSLTTN